MLPSRIAFCLLLLAAPTLANVTGECNDVYLFGLKDNGTECSSTVPNDSFNRFTCSSPYCTANECWDTVDDSTSLNSSGSASTDCWARWGFHDPAWNPATGAGLQTFRVKACRKYTSQTGDPDVTLTLYEDGSSLGDTNSGTITTDCGSGYDTVSLTWDATGLSNATGDDVEVLIELDNAGGGPGNKNTARVSFAEWVIVMDDPNTQTGFSISVVSGNRNVQTRR